ncbi:uncharacterized protein LOC112593722 [Melanaphis sacchari]|uniref:uncharacterized protein LOC112593722 n=1 Tax=Melanaphis sacchari TaxID=742174 RepID=UPI000DC156DB|nr:uncharacterized protein LOC112593722 [Melanaphis sacchari]
MLYDPPKTTLYVCTVLLHTASLIICTTIHPDINPTPPLEFPSDGLHVRIVQAVEPYNLTKPPMFNFGNNETITDEPTDKLQEAFKNELNDGVLKPSSQPINVIAKISKNYTENYIENKYYNNHIDSWTSITLTLIVLIVLSVMVLACSALCLKKIQNLKISKRQLLIEDYDDSVMNDLIHIQRV